MYLTRPRIKLGSIPSYQPCSLCAIALTRSWSRSARGRADDALGRDDDRADSLGREEGCEAAGRVVDGPGRSSADGEPFEPFPETPSASSSWSGDDDLLAEELALEEELVLVEE